MFPSLGLERFLPKASASATDAASSPTSAAVDVGVVGCERMAVLAVGLSGVLCTGPAPTQDVLSDRRDLHVRRVDASWVVAEVIDGKAIRDLPDQRLIGIPVGCVSSAQPGGEAPIAAHLRSGPLPAIAGLVDSGPEALSLGWHWDLRGMDHPRRRAI